MNLHCPELLTGSGSESGCKGPSSDKACSSGRESSAVTVPSLNSPAALKCSSIAKVKISNTCFVCSGFPPGTPPCKPSKSLDIWQPDQFLAPNALISEYAHSHTVPSNCPGYVIDNAADLPEINEQNIHYFIASSWHPLYILLVHGLNDNGYICSDAGNTMRLLYFHKTNNG